ncbi:MAG: type transport system ATP-binding protein [Solirubrobacteraceae bacterium]|jgi:ABC-2 type transport system ATP-binding protein|nr:type transport system ATP-binding protein [Solirubrobacteraceae bacterium]
MRRLLLDQTPREHAVETRNLSKRYSHGTHAVKGVSFAVPTGETFGLLGPPGAGKSTIMAMLSARILPTGGTARVAGFDVVKEAAQVRSLIGVQMPAVQDAACSHHRAPAPSKARCAPGRARPDRPVLLLDRPTNGPTAPDSADHLNRLVRLRESRRLTIVVAIDTLDHATTLCDQVALLDRGQIVAMDNPWALFAGIDDVIIEFLPSADPRAALEKLHTLGVTTRHAFRIEQRIALPVARHRADELNAIIHREQLSCSSVITRLPTINDVRVQLLGQLNDVAAA